MQRRSRDSVWVLWFGCLSIVSVLPSCESQDSSRVAREEGIVAGSPSAAGSWLFWPVSLRVHPLTRVNLPITDGGRATLDVRVEFRDRTEETTRAIGSLVIELHADGAEPGDRRWRYDLDSLAAHDRHYDQVTATYRFALAPDWPTDLRSAALVLKVYFYGVDGAVLSAEARLSPGLKSSLASKKVNAADL